MKYVALLSGGKDSCYNLIHCAQNGHELVAAASLRPEDGKGSRHLVVDRQCLSSL
jgi:diphthine-ammonia ligase